MHIRPSTYGTQNDEISFKHVQRKYQSKKPQENTFFRNFQKRSFSTFRKRRFVTMSLSHRGMWKYLDHFLIVFHYFFIHKNGTFFTLNFELPSVKVQLPSLMKIINRKNEFCNRRLDAKSSIFFISSWLHSVAVSNLQIILLIWVSKKTIDTQIDHQNKTYQLITLCSFCKVLMENASQC